jgi:hypothetical protein
MAGRFLAQAVYLADSPSGAAAPAVRVLGVRSLWLLTFGVVVDRCYLQVDLLLRFA